MKQATRKQWISCAIAVTIYLLFLVWLKSWLGLIVVPFIFDIYITKLVPWNFWKTSKNQALRSVMSWIDAIVFALVAVYFVNTFFFQNYQIPSSSLEKSLLVGDFLFVSKVSYGPRVPNTPLSMPLAQHTLPVFDCKSYIEFPQWGYKRAPGFGKVQRGDIVVFNFPAGDTVALNCQMSDFYTIAYEAGKKNYDNINMDSLNRNQQRMVYDRMYAEGRKEILGNPTSYGKIVVRPVDRRENYVKRCVGLPGDNFKIVNGQIYVNNVPSKNPENLQFNYLVQTTGGYIPEDLFRELGISLDDQLLLSTEYDNTLLAEGFTAKNSQGRLNPVYHLPLTKAAYQALNTNKQLIAKIKMESEEYSGLLYPLNQYTKWDRNNYGPIWIPQKGATVQLTMDNIAIYERPIHVYEGNKLDVKDGKIFINGTQTNSYTFKMDYYWMMGDNRDNSQDSRYWGFVPEDHIVGKPIVVWLSLDKDRGWFDGKIRWNRFFKLVSNI